MNKKTALVICPGRGVYNATELGYLSRFHSDKKDFIQKIDQFRMLGGEPSITELDSMDKFRPSLHAKGENAASLIYTCSYCDYLSISEEHDIVAITGNSMGWYIALACAQVLNTPASFHLINTMGGMLKDGLIGGQIIYPIVDENWNRDKELEAQVRELIKEHELYISIEFGGYLVIGGEDEKLKNISQKLPERERFPMKLSGNGAFHTPLFHGVSDRAFNLISADDFSKPQTPLIDGRGKIWTPWTTHLPDLYHYTLRNQVVDTYDFTRAIEVGIKEFCPNKVILLGPGTTIGGAVAQTLINNTWLKMSSKQDFEQIQKNDPFLLSMGMENQRKLVTG